jgi:hypothetical protein
MKSVYLLLCLQQPDTGPCPALNEYVSFPHILFVWNLLLLLLLLSSIVIIIIIFSSFLQGSHTYIPETNHIPREYTVAAILSLLFMVPVSPVPALTLLYFYSGTFRSMCAVPNMAVFCCSITSWFLGMLLTCFLNDFEMVPVAPIITGITLVFTLLLLLLLFHIYPAYQSGLLTSGLSTKIVYAFLTFVMPHYSRLMSTLLFSRKQNFLL